MCCSNSYIDFHFSVQSVVQQQVMRHPDPVWLHGMPLAIVIISDVAYNIANKICRLVGKKIYK